MPRIRVGGIAALIGGLATSATLVLAQDAPQGTCTRASADRSTTPTTECTRCHAFRARRGNFVMPGHEFGHPVDVDYDAVRATRSREFVPRADLPPFVSLADGRITCLTCHGSARPRAAEARHLGRELCLGCHTLDTG